MPVTAPEPAVAHPTAAPAAPVAFYLASRGEPLFAWLHPGRLGHALVVCPPLRQAPGHSHRSLRRPAPAADRRGVAPWCSRSLMAHRYALQDAVRRRPALAGPGIPTEEQSPPGYAGLMAEPHYTTVPHAAVAGVAEWLRLDDGPDAGTVELE